jgi:hypothetical protein
MGPFGKNTTCTIEHGNALRIAPQSDPALAQWTPQIDREFRSLLTPSETRGKALATFQHTHFAAQLKIAGALGRRREGRARSQVGYKKYVNK